MSDATPEQLIEDAQLECTCGHPRYRHTGCSGHIECCDEDGCSCIFFIPPASPLALAAKEEGCTSP